MKKKLVVLIALLLAFSTLFAVPTSAAWEFYENYNNTPENFAYSFAFVGDTQVLATLDADTTTLDAGMWWRYDTTDHIGKGYMGMIYDWILESKDEKKIAHVFGLGDIVESRDYVSGGKSARDEWDAAKAAWSRMDGKISYSMVRGNHDNNYIYNEYVCYDEYLSQFDGYFSSGVNVGRSTYKFLDIAQEKWLLVSLDFAARDDVLEWAGEIIKSNPDRRVIITTHQYLASSSKRTQDGVDTMYPTDLGYNHGEDIWNKLVRKYENIFMVVCGHGPANPMVLRRAKGDCGNTVYEIMINPHEYDAGTAPGGFVLMMYFSEDGSTFQMEYYSTIQDKYCKLPTTRVKYSEPRFTEAPETTTVAPETTVADDVNTNEEPSGCRAVAIIPALPITLGVTALAARKRKRR